MSSRLTIIILICIIVGLMLLLRNKSERTNIVFLIRSFNRPEYLKDTLTSVLKSDIDLCFKRYIYDDGSSDPETLALLSNPLYINQPGKSFKVIQNRSNRGCRLSYVDALNYIKSDNSDNPDIEYIINTVDNDVEVKPNFIQTCIDEYYKASTYYEKDVLLTGFNPSNAHKNTIESLDTFYRKTSCGGVHFMFHRDLLDIIINGWKINDDWGVNHECERLDIPICCLHRSIVNHIGQVGLYSDGERWDHDPNF